MIALGACKGDGHEPERRPKDKPAAKSAPKAPVVESAAAAVTAEPSGPRYLRPNAQGVMVDAFSFASVPASIVEQQVGAASTRSAAAGVLRRFGLGPLEGNTGQVWIGTASLVDRLGRERVLVVSFRGEPNGAGLRDDDGWIVFLGSTEEDRVLRVGSARVTARTTLDAPVDVDARELHSANADDVIARWSSCAKPFQKACHSVRAWTMQRGYPELILDVTGDTAPVVTGASAPHDVLVDGRVLKFDASTFAYR